MNFPILKQFALKWKCFRNIGIEKMLIYYYTGRVAVIWAGNNVLVFTSVKFWVYYWVVDYISR